MSDTPNVKNQIDTQWRIQDFPDGGAPTSQVGTPTYYFAQFLPKTAWKWKNLDPEEGGSCPWRPPLDPPMTLWNSWIWNICVELTETKRTHVLQKFKKNKKRFYFTQLFMWDSNQTSFYRSGFWLWNQNLLKIKIAQLTTRIPKPYWHETINGGLIYLKQDICDILKPQISQKRWKI